MMTAVATKLPKSIRNLDLSGIRSKLIDDDDGLGWTEAQADEGLKWYRRFLFLSRKYTEPEIQLVPMRFIDEVWHQHIQDTKAYLAACNTVFGAFMHHDPYFGVGPGGEERLEAAGQATNELFVEEFGESPRDTIVFGNGEFAAQMGKSHGCSHDGHSSRYAFEKLISHGFVNEFTS